MRTEQYMRFDLAGTVEIDRSSIDWVRRLLTDVSLL